MFLYTFMLRIFQTNHLIITIYVILRSLILVKELYHYSCYFYYYYECYYDYCSNLLISFVFTIIYIWPGTSFIYITQTYFIRNRALILGGLLGTSCMCITTSISVFNMLTLNGKIK